MSTLTTIEGTWDEIVQHSAELTGHRLRVTVLDPPPSHNASDPQSDPEQWIKSLYDWALNRPPLGPWDDSRDSIYNEISE